MEERNIIEKYKQATRCKHFILSATLTGTQGKIDYPLVDIGVNNQSLFRDRITGTQTIDLEVKDLSVNHILSIEMVDKTPNDTLVEQGKIVKDKSLQINKIYIDGVDIKLYVYQGKQIPVYHFEGQGPEVVTGEHLFFPGPWELTYQNPPRLFFANWSGHAQLINSPAKQKTKNNYLKKIKNLMV
jgi:hypothetical protein